MNRTRPAIVSAALALVAGTPLIPLNTSAAEGDGTTGSGAIRYLAQSIVWTQDHSYADWGASAALNVGTGAGEGHLSVQNGARVEIPGSLFIGGKGYGSPYRVEEGHDGLVTVGPDSTLECGSQASHSGSAQIYVGWGSGVKGTLRVNGGELISNYILRVGCHVDSDGLMEVLGGGRVTLRRGEQIADTDACFLSIATAAGSRGLLRVAEGSTLEFSLDPGERTRAEIGAGGNGTLLVEGGSRVSLGQDYAHIGGESGSQGLVYVREGSRLELPGVTYLARDAGSRGDIVIEGSGSLLVGQDLAVGEQGNAALVLRDSGRADVAGTLAVGAREGSGTGQVSVSSGAQLVTSGSAVVGSSGVLQLSDGGQWVSSAPVSVTSGGLVQLSGSSRWEVQDAVNFRSGSTLSFVLNSLEQVPEVVVAPGAILTLPAGSRLQLTLSDALLSAAAQGGFELPLIQGELVDEGYDYVLRDKSGLLDTSGLEELADGQWGLRVTLDRNALQRTLRDDASRLVNGLWSSTGVVQDYTSALMDRPQHQGGRHLWSMGLGSFSRMSTHAGSPGFDFNGGGYALGADAALRERASLGLSFGQLCGSNQSTDGLTRIRQNSLMGSLYARYDSRAGEPGRRLVLDAYAAYGRVSNRARSSMYGTGAERSTGRWSDDVYALGLRASWARPLTENASLLPFIGLRYLHGSHGSFTMASDELVRSYSSASLHNLSIPLGLTLRGRYTLRHEQQLLPELTLAYVWDVSRDNPHLATDMLGSYAESSGAAPGKHAFMLRTGAAWVINENWATGLYYHLERRNHELEQGVNLSVSYGF